MLVNKDIQNNYQNNNTSNKTILDLINDLNRNSNINTNTNNSYSDLFKLKNNNFAFSNSLLSKENMSSLDNNDLFNYLANFINILNNQKQISNNLQNNFNKSNLPFLENLNSNNIKKSNLFCSDSNNFLNSLKAVAEELYPLKKKIFDDTNKQDNYQATTDEINKAFQDGSNLNFLNFQKINNCYNSKITHDMINNSQTENIYAKSNNLLSNNPFDNSFVSLCHNIFDYFNPNDKTHIQYIKDKNLNINNTNQHSIENNNKEIVKDDISAKTNKENNLLSIFDENAKKNLNEMNINSKRKEQTQEYNYFLNLNDSKNNEDKAFYSTCATKNNFNFNTNNYSKYYKNIIENINLNKISDSNKNSFLKENSENLYNFNDIITNKYKNSINKEKNFDIDNTHPIGYLKNTNANINNLDNLYQNYQNYHDVNLNKKINNSVNSKNVSSYDHISYVDDIPGELVVLSKISETKNIAKNRPKIFQKDCKNSQTTKKTKKRKNPNDTEKNITLKELNVINRNPSFAAEFNNRIKNMEITTTNQLKEIQNLESVNKCEIKNNSTTISNSINIFKDPKVIKSLKNIFEENYSRNNINNKNIERDFSVEEFTKKFFINNNNKEIDQIFKSLNNFDVSEKNENIKEILIATEEKSSKEIYSITCNKIKHLENNTINEEAYFSNQNSSNVIDEIYSRKKKSEEILRLTDLSLNENLSETNKEYINETKSLLLESNNNGFILNKKVLKIYKLKKKENPNMKNEKLEIDSPHKETYSDCLILKRKLKNAINNRCRNELQKNLLRNKRNLTNTIKDKDFKFDLNKEKPSIANKNEECEAYFCLKYNNCNKINPNPINNSINNSINKSNSGNKPSRKIPMEYKIESSINLNSLTDKSTNQINLNQKFYQNEEFKPSNSTILNQNNQSKYSKNSLNVHSFSKNDLEIIDKVNFPRRKKVKSENYNNSTNIKINNAE